MVNVGQTVCRKSDGALGTVTSVSDAEITVSFPSTGRIAESPWGAYTDAGSEAHIRPQYAARLLTVAS